MAPGGANSPNHQTSPIPNRGGLVNKQSQEYLPAKDKIIIRDQEDDRISQALRTMDKSAAML